VAGSHLTLTVSAQYTLGSGTVGTHTLNANAYRTANDGTQVVSPFGTSMS
jgi:hypothetical protein